MTKQEAITVLKELKRSSKKGKTDKALEMAIEALSNDSAIAVVNELITINNNMIIKASKDRLAASKEAAPYYEGISIAYHGRNLTYEALLKRLKAG